MQNATARLGSKLFFVTAFLFTLLSLKTLSANEHHRFVMPIRSFDQVKEVTHPWVAIKKDQNLHISDEDAKTMKKYYRLDLLKMAPEKVRNLHSNSVIVFTALAYDEYQKTKDQMEKKELVSLLEKLANKYLKAHTKNPEDETYEGRLIHAVGELTPHIERRYSFDSTNSDSTAFSSDFGSDSDSEASEAHKSKSDCELKKGKRTRFKNAMKSLISKVKLKKNRKIKVI